ncbi:hypothetical protein OOJ91_34240 [Micromonospora lupini]|uniref:hypothetical protein n=1 Tax=Micromonospora lupini TaxID=285679 RepID=UPI002258D0E4|nr:hypothetical protein [Micromonospora lupini]MCX5070910.1 hypothetical protein [Micromonospora lupini]
MQTHPTAATPIPLRLLHRPVVAGLAVPWITARTPNGPYRFGAVDTGRAAAALERRWCQICGQPLDARFVFAMRDRDVDRSIAAEAAMHPECFRYSTQACPMLAGSMSHYRSTARGGDLAGISAILGDPHGVRAGKRAERWHAVWARDYIVFDDPLTGLAAALLRPHHIVRVRPLATWAQGSGAGRLL